MNWLARVKKKNKGKDNKNVCTSKIQNNNPAVEYFDINSPLNEKEKVIVNLLYDYYTKNDTLNFIEPIYDDYDKTIFDFIDKFIDDPGKLKHLLEKIPDKNVLKYVFDERYTYDEVINILFPYYSKIGYIDGMKNKKYTSDQIKYCIENEIFISFYHDEFDYDKIDMLIKEKEIVFNRHEKNNFYKLEFDLLSKIISNYDKSSVIEILASILYPPINTFKIRTELIPLLIEKEFTADEIKLLMFAINEVNKEQIAKLNLFLRASTKKECFKMVFEMFCNN